MDIKIKENFLLLVESLKRSQRADIIENNQSIIEKLYTDPFEGDYVLNQMLNDQTTILIGRKGTGKSTIINRFQHEIRKSKDRISLYLDVRTIYSKASNSIDNANSEDSLLMEDQTRLSIYQIFIRKIIEEIKEEINRNIFEKNEKKWTNKFTDLFRNRKSKISEEDFEEKLNTLLVNSLQDQYEDITAIRKNGIIQENNSSQNNLGKSHIGFNLGSDKLSIDVGGEGVEEKKISSQKSLNFSSILKRKFHISDFSDELKKLLIALGINKVYLCLDDSSELDQEALEIFIKTIVSPLHNDSDGFFRFKIAFYPERNVLPEIDRSKIDTIFLDYYHMYKSSGADKVEEQAISYIKRLIQGRIKYFFGTEEIEKIENIIFDTKSVSVDEYYKLIFYACSCIPRNIGRLFFYSNKRGISQDKPINKSLIQESAEEQYINDIEPILNRDEFFQYKSYSEIYKRTQLKELVHRIIDKAKENKKQIGESSSTIFANYNPSTAPSQFLYLNKKNISNYVSTLEINFFITRISEQKDKGYMEGNKFISNDVVVYTINYGLCQKENIVFEEVKDRKFRIERIFNYNKLVEEWSNSSAFVECVNCHAEYDISEWEKIKEFDCYCKECKIPNVCTLTSKYYSNDTCLQETNLNLDLPDLKPEQLRIIHSLYIENNLSENKIAGELDVSTSSIRAYLREDRILRKNGWITKDENNKTYLITEKSKNYFYKENNA